MGVGRVDRLQPGDPSQIGPFRLLGRLGEGGMGRVFLGASPGGRKVAVKIVHPHYANDPEFRGRFAREVATARQVGGFHTAAVVGADPEANPPWMATAYIAGPSLAEAIAQHGPLDEAGVRELGAALAEGLAAIHDCGLIHRDLKPGNVILADDGPRIIDFGIAKGADATALTGSNAVIGTLRYMSPEQLHGRELTTQSDVFALGAILAYAATGHDPFEAPAIPAVITRILNDPPGLDPLTGDLRGIIADCLAKEPGGRPSPCDLLVRFGHAEAHDPTVIAAPVPVSTPKPILAALPPPDPQPADASEPEHPVPQEPFLDSTINVSPVVSPNRTAPPAAQAEHAFSTARKRLRQRDRRRAGLIAAGTVAVVSLAILGVFVLVSRPASTLSVTGTPSPPASSASSPGGSGRPTASWQLTGSMAAGHGNWYNGGFAELPNGRVLAISGAGSTGVLTPTAEIYDPGTGRWTPAGSLHDARYAFGQPSVLPDGDVLVAGGHDANVVDYATAELYDPATNQWTFTGSLNTSRRYPVQVELASGEVLVATGSHGPPTCTRYLSSAELYNPATGQWTYTGSTLVPRESATVIRLADGRVLLAGGYNGGGSACTDTDPVDTETYDPSTGQWSRAGDLPHGWLGGAIVLLPDHRVLMVDGSQQGSGDFAEAVIFDPATNQWSEAAAPKLPRSGAEATLLPDGKVLVSQGGQPQSEIYDPVTNTWSLDATARGGYDNGHTFLLPDGKVLLAGGSTSKGASTIAELYTPAPPP
jgi:serine/threonine protein kinase